MQKNFANGALGLEFDGDVALLTINRPNKRNALNRHMWLAIPEAVIEVEARRQAKVLILAGAGPHFAAGADIGEFESVYATRDSSAEYAQEIALAIAALAHMSKPSIAKISGACVGGGLSLALACDIRVTSDDARFGITPGKLGLMYSLSDTKRLLDAVGASAAKEMLFTGRIMSAVEALAIGLVDAVHPPAALAAAVAEKAGLIAAASQWSARKTKAVISLILSGVHEDTEDSRAWFVDAVEGEDFIEGRNAFLAKRQPTFPFR